MKYKIIEFAINNQRLFNSLTIVIFIMGAFLYITTPRDIFPRIKEAEVVIQVIYPGASADVIQQQIVVPIEQKISLLPEIKSSSSVSRKNVGISRFLIDRQYYDQLNDVRQSIQNKLNDMNFPDEAESPKVSISTLNDNPFMHLFIDNSDPKKAHEISILIEKELNQISYLKETEIYGRREYQFQILADPILLANYGISLGEIYQAVNQSKTDIPSGEITYREEMNTLTVTLPLNNVEDIRNIVLRANEVGDLLRIKDVAEVKFDFETPNSYHMLNGQQGIIFGFVKNELGDISKLQKQLATITQKFQQLYPDTKIELFFDKSVEITDRIQLLNENLTIGLILVFIVLLLFFNFSTALWTTMGVPVSFCIGLILSVMLGLNINIMAMIGFILILGVVVDDGIVFSENAYRHFEMGKSPKQAVIDGMGEVSTSVIFATLTTIASICMQLSLDGKIGDLARPIPIVIICTLFGSLFESLLVLPGHLVHAFEHAKHRVKKENSNKGRIFNTLQQYYEKLLRFLVYHRKKSLFIIVTSVTTLTIVLFQKIPFVFYASPPDEIFVFFDTPVGTPLDKTEQSAKIITDYLHTIPELNNIYTIAGFQDDASRVAIMADVNKNTDPNFDWLLVKNNLKKHIESQDEHLNNFRINVLGGDSFYLDKLEITIKGTNQNDVVKLATSIQEFVKNKENVDNPRLNIPDKIYNQNILVDATKSKIYGISPRDIALNVGIAYEGADVGTIYSNDSSYDIRLQYNNESHTYTSLTNMRIPNKLARFVSLTEMVDITNVLIEKEIFTEDGLYTVKVLDSLYDTSILSNNSIAIIDQVKKEFSNFTNGDLNASIYLESERAEVEEGVQDIAIALTLGVSFVLLILLYLFNSFISTFLAIIGIPFIFLGLTVGLYIMKLPINNMALIGLISLIGLVVNDAIVLLEHLYHSLKREKLFLNSLVTNVSTRFRPIMMTVSTTLVGVAPIAFGFAGNEYLLQPLAVVTFFGVLVVSIITLIILPLMISILEIDGKGLFFKYYRSSFEEFFKHIKNLIFPNKLMKIINRSR